MLEPAGCGYRLNHEPWTQHRNTFGGLVYKLLCKAVDGPLENAENREDTNCCWRRQTCSRAVQTGSDELPGTPLYCPVSGRGLYREEKVGAEQQRPEEGQAG